MKGINYKDNRRTEGAKGRKGCFPQITKLLPPRAGSQESTFDAELLEGGVAPSAATVGTVLMHWVVSQEPTLLIFLRLGDLMPQLPAVILRSPLLLLPMLEIEKKQKNKKTFASVHRQISNKSLCLADQFIKVQYCSRKWMVEKMGCQQGRYICTSLKHLIHMFIRKILIEENIFKFWQMREIFKLLKYYENCLY